MVTLLRGPSDWPFAIKMALSPALAIVVMVALAIYGIGALNRQAALIWVVAGDDLHNVTVLSDAAAQLQAINGALYREATLQATHLKGLNVGRDTTALAVRAAHLADDLSAASPRLETAADRVRLADVIARIRMYRDEITVFGSMLELDFASALALVQPFDAEAGKVLRNLGDIAHHAGVDAELRAARSEQIANHVRVLIATVEAVLAALLIAMTAWLTRATVRSVRLIAAATESVARGNTNLDVDGLARGDELGIIVRSLAIFKANVSQIAFLAKHDALTGLPNRVLLEERMQYGLMQAGRGCGFAVLCLDLDRFKAVNDTLGHAAGDTLLRQVGQRLQASVREGDLVARVGGDEFVVVLFNLIDPSEIDHRAARIIDVVSSAYQVDRHPISIGTSIGVTVAPVDGETPDDLLRNADTALYSAKAGGRGITCFYEPAMNTALQARRKVEIELQHAITRGEFQVYYQPLVEARCHQVCGFEALIRWNHPELGVVSPDDFIGVAETTGLICSIGHWVLRQACRDAVTWPGNIKVAVNLSPAQFRDKNLVANVRNAIADSGLVAARLELEVTESVLLRDSDVVLNTLREIKSLGVKISMDDFGTGYSSLSYLRSFPFDKVKIDRSFIKDLPHDANAMAIVRAIVGLSETFGMEVTAEGVETDAQAVELALEACTQLQGYLFSRPIPADNVPDLIRTLTASSQQKAASLTGG